MRGIVRSFWRRILGWFLTGLFTILPLVITVAVIAWVGGLIHRMIGPGSFVGRRRRIPAPPLPV